MAQATFGAGCFWEVEEVLRKINGVISTQVGYTGGTLENPTYEDVCTGITGHAEAVQLEFDPSKISYVELLAAFWRMHDPTTLNRQGSDIGTQYRSVVFYHNEAQKAHAEASMDRLQESGLFKDIIVTEIQPAAEFYAAEEYHQRYLEKKGLDSCH